MTSATSGGVSMPGGISGRLPRSSLSRNSVRRACTAFKVNTVKLDQTLVGLVEHA